MTANRPLNSTQDFLDALEQDPQLKEEIRKHILGEALLALPAMVGLPEPGEETLVSQMRQATVRLGSLDGKTDNMQSRLGNVAGAQYEQRVARQALSRVRAMGVERAWIAFSAAESQPAFHDAMAEAVEAGRITQPELEDLLSADAILRGANHRHAVIEASLGTDEEDLERAARRAGILARATGEETVPVVAAPSWPPEIITEARQAGIEVLSIAA